MQIQQLTSLHSITAAFLFVLMIGSIISLVRFNRKQKNVFVHEVELMRSNYEIELFKTQLEIQEETFQHISLELHDHVGHFLTLAKLHLTTCKTNLPEEITGKIDAAVLLIAHSLDEIRQLSKSLNTENIKSNGLIKTVEQLIDQFNNIGQFKVILTVTGSTCYLEDLKEIVLFRILQESLNNIVKHAKADTIHIQLHYNHDSLLLSISDNGVGFRAASLLYKDNCSTSGLNNILKRSSLINATPEILSWPDKGTTINISTPYN